MTASPLQTDPPPHSNSPITTKSSFSWNNHHSEYWRSEKITSTDRRKQGGQKMGREPVVVVVVGKWRDKITVEIKIGGTSANNKEETSFGVKKKREIKKIREKRIVYSRFPDNLKACMGEGGKGGVEKLGTCRWYKCGEREKDTT